MNVRLKIILTGLVLSLMTHALMLFIDHYFLIHMGDWTMKIFKKYLVFNLSSLDRFLISWLPLILAFVYLILNIQELAVFIKKVIWSIITVLTFFLFGIVIGLWTWTSDGGDSILLPEYLKYQPIKFYWTIFISLGLVLPTIPTLIKYLKNMDSTSNDIIDS